MPSRLSSIGYALQVLSLCASIGCDSGASLDADDAGEREREPSPRAAREPDFCARAGEDAVRDLFCAAPPANIRNLIDLQVALDLRPAIDGAQPVADRDDGFYTLFSVAVLGHSTALDGQLVSPINPRVIVMGAQSFLTFQRGAQRVELISRARDRDTLNFYLLEFEQACNERKQGCSHGDLYTPQIESDWQKVTIRDGEELKNTPMDCRVCHQRNTERPSLLMRELETPWTHFFLPPSSAVSPGVSGSDLFTDYVRAKGDELYAGFALHTISDRTPFFLEGIVGPKQPLLFDAPVIEAERHPYGPDGFVAEPQPSPTWERAYEAFKRGEQLSLPYLEPRASDLDKQAALTDAYQRFRARELAADELPDLADVYPDDALERARRGLQTEPDATPQEALIQACASCHNDALDQTISRARFNVRVSSLSRRALDTAIERLRRPSSAAGAMPPREARQLDPDARKKLIDYLRGKPAADDSLDNAATLGMMGGAGQSRASGNVL